MEGFHVSTLFLDRVYLGNGPSLSILLNDNKNLKHMQNLGVMMNKNK